MPWRIIMLPVYVRVAWWTGFPLNSYAAIMCLVRVNTGAGHAVTWCRPHHQLLDFVRFTWTRIQSRFEYIRIYINVIESCHSISRSYVRVYTYTIDVYVSDERNSECNYKPRHPDATVAAAGKRHREQMGTWLNRMRLIPLASLFPRSRELMKQPAPRAVPCADAGAIIQQQKK